MSDVRVDEDISLPNEHEKMKDFSPIEDTENRAIAGNIENEKIEDIQSLECIKVSSTHNEPSNEKRCENQDEITSNKVELQLAEVSALSLDTSAVHNALLSALKSPENPQTINQLCSYASAILAVSHESLKAFPQFDMLATQVLNSMSSSEVYNDTSTHLKESSLRKVLSSILEGGDINDQPTMKQLRKRAATMLSVSSQSLKQFPNFDTIVMEIFSRYAASNIKETQCEDIDVSSTSSDDFTVRRHRARSGSNSISSEFCTVTDETHTNNTAVKIRKSRLRKFDSNEIISNDNTQTSILKRLPNLSSDVNEVSKSARRQRHYDEIRCEQSKHFVKGKAHVTRRAKRKPKSKTLLNDSTKIADDKDLSDDSIMMKSFDSVAKEAVCPHASNATLSKYHVLTCAIPRDDAQVNNEYDTHINKNTATTIIDNAHSHAKLLSFQGQRVDSLYNIMIDTCTVTLQVLEHDYLDQWIVFEHWGADHSHNQKDNVSSSFNTLNDAIKFFRCRFHERTSLYWPVIEWPNDLPTNNFTLKSHAEKIMQKYTQWWRDDNTVCAIENLVNDDMKKACFECIGLRNENDLWKVKVKQVRELIYEIQCCIGKDAASVKAHCEALHVAVRHASGFPEAIINDSNIRHCSEFLQLIDDCKSLYEALDNEDGIINFIRLNISPRVCSLPTQSLEHTLIANAISNASSSALSITNIIAIDRENDHQSYESFPRSLTRRLLWIVCRPTAFLRLLWFGLQGMFTQQSDCCTYAYETIGDANSMPTSLLFVNRQAMVILAEVVVGQSQHVSSPALMRRPAKGFHSILVKGIKRCSSMSSISISGTEGNTSLELGSGALENAVDSSDNVSELSVYGIYDKAQIRPRFAVVLKRT